MLSGKKVRSAASLYRAGSLSFSVPFILPADNEAFAKLKAEHKAAAGKLEVSCLYDRGADVRTAAAIKAEELKRKKHNLDALEAESEASKAGQQARDVQQKHDAQIKAVMQAYNPKVSSLSLADSECRVHGPGRDISLKSDSITDGLYVVLLVASYNQHLLRGRPYIPALGE